MVGLTEATVEEAIEAQKERMAMTDKVTQEILITGGTMAEAVVMVVGDVGVTVVRGIMIVGATMMAMVAGLVGATADRGIAVVTTMTVMATAMVTGGVMVVGSLLTEMKAEASLVNDRQSGFRENIYQNPRSRGLESKSSATALKHPHQGHGLRTTMNVQSPKASPSRSPNH